MTATIQPDDLDVQGTNAPASRRVLSRKLAVAQLAALLLAVIAAGITVALNRHSPNWGSREFLDLAILAAMAVTSELTASYLPSGAMNISGSFLGIMLAAVLLGGPAAAVVGLLTIGIGWIKWRESGHAFRQNLLTFAWFPLLSGLWFRGIANARHIPAFYVQGHAPHAGYYLLVFATFMVGLGLNWGMTAAYVCWFERVPVLHKLADFKPVIAAEALVGTAHPDRGLPVSTHARGRPRAVRADPRDLPETGWGASSISTPR